MDIERVDFFERSGKVIAKLDTKTKYKIMVINQEGEVFLGNYISIVFYTGDINIVEDDDLGLVVEYEFCNLLDENILRFDDMMKDKIEDVFNEEQIKSLEEIGEIPKLHPYQIDILERENSFVYRFDVYEKVNEFEYEKINEKRILELLGINYNVNLSTKDIYDI
jgi:hypothetical protein